MNYLYKKNKTIIVKSSSENPHYKQMKKDTATNIISDGLKSRNIEVIEDLSNNASNNSFDVFFYGQNGSLFLTENKYDGNTFESIFDYVDKSTPKKIQVGGSKDDNYYKYKYHKYKNKFFNIKNVATTFCPV